MNNFKILVIDDDELDRAYYKTMLLNDPEFSAEILEADNALSGLEICRKEHLDCILIDYLLPGMNGIDFLKELKKDYTIHTPVIMLTGQGDENIAVTAMKEGVSDYIIKNQVNPHNLSTTILNVIKKSQIDTKVEEQKEKLKQYAYYDQLTGVLNRHSFADSAIRAISDAKRHHRLLAILYLDLDHFKEINDNFGHSTGDELLKETTRRIARILRKEDIVARLGGDEFAVLLTGLNTMADVNVVATKIINEVYQPYQLGRIVVHVNVSIGIACFPEAGINLTELLRNADIALYKAKEAGRGVFQFYSEEIKNIQQKRMFIEHGLKNGLDKNEFFIVYQPQFELVTKKIVGFEALLRWQHPDLGIITPDKFISIAEETGMIVAIDEWMINSVYQQLQEWHVLCLSNQLRVSVNVSSQTLTHANFIPMLDKINSEYKIPVKCMELEVMESALMQLDANEPIFNELKKRKIALTIDDFGREYSSFQHLKLLPLTGLKIDNSFLRDVARGKADEAIVKSIINIGHDLDLKVIAEGIETEFQYNFLLEQGCPYGQGFYFSKPLKIEQASEFISQQLGLQQSYL